MANYSVQIQSSVGDTIDLIDDWLHLTYTRAVAGIGGLELTLDGDYPLDYISVDGRILVYRNGHLEIDAPWLIRKWLKSLDEQGTKTLTVYAVSANELLTRRIVAYPSGASQSSKSDYPDNVMKAIIRENFGSSASDTNRSVASYLSVDTDASQGISISKSFSRDNVFEVLQEITQTTITDGSAIYFDVVGASSLQFRTYPTFRGIDHTFPNGLNPVTFSPEMGNLSTVNLSFDRSQEVTFVYAGGSGSGAGRLIQTACSVDRLGESVFNRREYFRDVSSTSATATLQAEAKGELRNGRPVRTFDAQILSTEATQYGVHWGLGDAITAVFDGDSFNCTIDSVTVTVADSKEEISATLRVEED